MSVKKENNPILDAITIRESVKKSTDDALRSVIEQQMKEEMKRIIKEDDSDYEEDEVNVEKEPETEMPKAEPEVENEKEADAVVDDNEDVVVDEEMPEEGEEELGDDVGGEFEVEDETYEDVSQDDETAIKVFKSMSNSGQIVIKKDGGTIELSDEETGADYIIDLNEDDVEVEEEVPFTESIDEAEEEMVDENLTRTHRSLRNGGKASKNQIKVPVDQGRVRAVRDGEQLKTENKMLNDKLKKMVAENIILKESVKQLKESAQSLFATAKETALTNQKLGKAMRLFSEHATTIDEKKNIIERFEGNKTAEEIDKLYETIRKELTTRKPVITESIDKTFSNVATEIKLEQPSYINEDTKRIYDLMMRMEKRK